MESLQKILHTERLDGILVHDRPNIRYFSNFTGSNGWLLFTKKSGYLFTDFRYLEVARKILPKHIHLKNLGRDFETWWKKFLKKLRIRKLGVEYTALTHAKFQKWKCMSRPAVFQDISESIVKLRMAKRNDELQNLRQAQDITDKIFLILKKTLKAGVSEKALAWKIECLARELGADDISFTPIVGIGNHSATPHHQNTDRKLRRGDLVLLDFGVTYHGYCSDMTRVLFSAQPSSLEQKIYSIVREAQETVETRLKPEITGEEADTIARKIIQKAGYGKYFGHSLGHGVGLEIHELPTLAQKYKKELGEKSVVTVEPGIYLPGKFGIRLEDMGIIGREKFSVLTKSPKDLRDVRMGV